MSMLPLGETVLLWRNERGMTQVALARAARITRPNLSAIERGTRDVTLGTLRALAEALQVRPGVLADGLSPYGEPTALSRVQLERVARAAATGTDPGDPREKALADCLRQVMAPASATLRMPGGRRQRSIPSDQQSALAYLKLHAMASPETIASLCDRLAWYGERS